MKETFKHGEVKALPTLSGHRVRSEFIYSARQQQSRDMQMQPALCLTALAPVPRQKNTVNVPSLPFSITIIQSGQISCQHFD